jgi:dTDP-4-amino-4,6-dideoxygalactose transaminase
MEGIQGAVLRVKLNHIERWTEARRTHAAAYDRLLANSSIGLGLVPQDARHVYHVYAVRLRNRDIVQQRLTQSGIATGMHYPVPVHLQPAYADLGYPEGAFPLAERFARETLSLPMFPELRRDEIEQVAAAVIEAADACAA